MKKLFIVTFLVVLLFSCNEYKGYYDIDAPKYIFSAQTSDQVLFQFDEPVKEIKYSIRDGENEKVKEIKNIYPVANIYVERDFFDTTGDLYVELKDNMDNTDNYKIPMPVINDNPAEFEISDIQLKYSKKRLQNFIIKSVKAGNTSGFSVIFFINGEIYEYQMESENIKAGRKFKFEFNPDKTNYKVGGNIKFSEKFVRLITKMRLSPSISLICIKNHVNEISDYCLYYDSKQHPLEYYMDKKIFKNMISYLESYDIDPDFTDIKGNTIRKHIIKLNKKFIVKTSV